MLKKIETSGQKKSKKEKRKLIGIIIAAIFVLSTVGFTLMQDYSSEEKQEYNDFIFIKRDNMWITTVNNQQITTYNLPRDVENITQENPNINRGDFPNKVVYFIAKSEEEKQASYLLSQYIQALRKQYACFPGDNSSECEDLPEKKCGEPGSAVIIIKDSTQEMYPSYINLTINQTNGNNEIEIINMTREIFHLDYNINESKITYSEGCLKILGKKEDFTKLIEKTIFLT